MLVTDVIFIQSFTFEINTATIPAINKNGAKKLPKIGRMIGNANATIIVTKPIVKLLFNLFVFFISVDWFNICFLDL